MGASRRDSLRLLTAGAAGLGLNRLGLGATEPPPETTRIRLLDFPISCFAELYVAEALLKAEGFTEVVYVPWGASLLDDDAASGRVDIVQNDAPSHVMSLERGMPVVVVGGIHTGCFELVAQTSIRSVRELKGRTVAAPPRSSRRAFVAAMAASVGLDPQKDIVWRDHTRDESMRQFEQGSIDALMGFAPEPQMLRAKNLGHTLINTLTDRPWSQYFCCLVAANREFLRRNPIATKRALRALMKASDLCASQPELGARALMARSGDKNFGFALDSVKEIGYGTWRDYQAEDTMRYWALRLREFGFIKSDPKKLLAQSTDWRFIEQLKKELKT
jgi:NitT/TauT family transport system substrate-binding protein